MNLPRNWLPVIIVLLGCLVLTMRAETRRGPQPVAGQAAGPEAVIRPVSGTVIDRAVESEKGSKLAMGIIPAAGAIENYVYDPDPSVRAVVVDALPVLGDRASIQVLAGLLYEKDRRVPINAVTALGEIIGGTDASDYLRQLRCDAGDSIRVGANAILAEEACTAAC